MHDSIKFVKDLNLADSIAIGCQSKDEVDCNVDLIIHDKYNEKLKELSDRKRKLIMEDYCIGCGKCIKRCDQNALYLENNKAKVNTDKCVLCGYCATVCEDFYIKVI